MDQICPKRVFPVENEKSEQHHWILHIRIRLGAIFLGDMALLSQYWPSMAPLGHVQNSQTIKRQLTLYGTSKPRWVNKNAMALLGQSKDSWPSMAPLGHVLFSFSFSFLFLFSILFLFSFSLFLFSFLLFFYFSFFLLIFFNFFLNFTMAPLGHHSGC